MGRNSFGRRVVRTHVLYDIFIFKLMQCFRDQVVWMEITLWLVIAFEPTDEIFFSFQLCNPEMKQVSWKVFLRLFSRFVLMFDNSIYETTRLATET